MKRAALLSVVLLFIGSLPANAASIRAVRDYQVIVDLQGAEVEPGEEFFVIDPETRKRSGIIRIVQVRPNAALAEIVRGRALKGQTLQARARTPISADVTPEMLHQSESLSRRPIADSRAPGQNYQRLLKPSYGVLGGLSINNMDATVSGHTGVGPIKDLAKMQGMGFAVGGFYEHIMSPNFSVRAYLGLDHFNAQGSIESTTGAKFCGSANKCDVNIMFLSALGYLKWYPSISKIRPWVGGSLGYLIPMSKSGSALKNIPSMQVMGVAGGVDFQKSRQVYIPVSLEYILFPKSETVNASSIVIRAGWAWNF